MVNFYKITLHEFHCSFYSEKELKIKKLHILLKIFYVVNTALKYGDVIKIYSNGRCSLGCMDTKDSCVSI